MINDYVFNLLMDRLKSIDDRLEDLQEGLKEHTKKDDGYWRKIDAQETQISLLKVIFGGTTFVGIVTIIWTWITTLLKG